MMNSKEMKTAVKVEQQFAKSLTPEQKMSYLETATETGSLLYAEKACKKVVVPVTGAPLIGSRSYTLQDGDFSVFRGKNDDIVIFCHGSKNGGIRVMKSVMDFITKGYFEGDERAITVSSEELKMFISCFVKMFNATAVTVVCCYGGANRDFVIDDVPVTFAVKNRRAAVIDYCSYIENEIVAWEGDDLTEIYFNILPLLM